MKRLLALIFLFNCSLHAQIAATSVSVTDDEEIKAGQVLAKKFEQAEGIKATPQSIKIDAYLQRVGERVAAHAQRSLPYRFHFDPNPKFKSAMGLPGGEIFVGGGILAYIDSEDQLAAVLGHEIEHIALNHCRDRLVKLLSHEHLSANKVALLKIGDFFPTYGHDSELAADREGVKLAIEAGYSPKAAIRLLRTFLILEQQTSNAPAESKIMLEERIAQIESLADMEKNQPQEKPFALP